MLIFGIISSPSLGSHFLRTIVNLAEQIHGSDWSDLDGRSILRSAKRQLSQPGSRVLPNVSGSVCLHEWRSRVQVFDDAGKIVFKKPLWLMIAERRRPELSSKQAYDCHSRRYDIEHCFRFGKQKLLLARSQTPDTRHEENLAWIA